MDIVVVIKRIYADDQMVIFKVDFSLFINFLTMGFYVCENQI